MALLVSGNNILGVGVGCGVAVGVGVGVAVGTGVGVGVGTGAGVGVGSCVGVGSGVFVDVGDAVGGGVGLGVSVGVGTGIDVGSCVTVDVGAISSAPPAAPVARISGVGAGIWVAARVGIVVGVVDVDVGVSLIQAMMDRPKRRITSLASNGAPLQLKDPVSVPSPDPSQGKPTRGQSAESLSRPTLGIYEFGGVNHSLGDGVAEYNSNCANLTS